MFNRVTINDTANGPGIRVTVWFQGCNHHCKGCHNPETWNPTKGKPLTLEVINKILDAVDKPYIRGLTLSGGDPLLCTNAHEANSLADHFRKRFGKTKDLWIWTGYLWEEVTWEEVGHLYTHPCILDADVLVDGKFDITKKTIAPYFGSSNQRVISVEESLNSHRVVLWQEEPLNQSKMLKPGLFQSAQRKIQQAMTSMQQKIQSFLPSGRTSGSCSQDTHQSLP